MTEEETNEIDLYQTIENVVGRDLVQLFGATGSGKTTFCQKVMESALQHGKKILVLDTEKSFQEIPKNVTYKYYADFADVAEYVEKLPKGFELIVFDSLGLPILGKYGDPTVNLRDKGDILLKCARISYMLKVYCQKNNAIGLVTNQPESEFNKGPYHVLRPFGDKARFYYKEIWTSKLIQTGEAKTMCRIESHRSRHYGRKTPLFELEITKKGCKVEPKI